MWSHGWRLPSSDVYCRSKIIIASQVLAVARLCDWTVAHVLTCQEHVDLAEGRTASFVNVAALNQQVVDFTRTDTRLRQTQGGPVGCAVIQLDVEGDQL